MPFKSEKQRRWMHANEPAMAKRWEAESKRSGAPAIQPSEITEGLPAHRKAAKKPKK